MPADNIVVTQGSGITVRTDDVGGVQYQEVKIAVGGDGAATQMPGGAGASTAGSPRVIHATDDPAVLNTQVRLIDITPVIDIAGAYANGDTLFDRTLVNGACRANDIPCELVSVQMIDEDDEAAIVCDLYFLSGDVVFGTINAAPSISDTDSRQILGHLSIAAADWKDLGGVKTVSQRNIGLAIKPAAGTDDIWVAAVNVTGTPTYTAATDIKLRLGFR